MTTRQEILERAEHVFDGGGFAGSGIDALTAAAGVSSRTFYKHVGSKAELVVTVLRLRHERFFRAIADVDTVDALFARLEEWTRTEGARGCLFLRARGEAGDADSDVGAVVAGYRDALQSRIAELVSRDMDSSDMGDDDALLAEQVLVLFEGATTAASYRGATAVDAARQAAGALLDSARAARGASR